MTLNNVEALNSAMHGKSAENSGINCSNLKASIFDNYIGNISEGNLFERKTEETKDTLILSNKTDSDIYLNKAEFKTTFDTVLKSEPKGFFSALKDFIMGFGDINPEEICY